MTHCEDICEFRVANHDWSFEDWLAFLGFAVIDSSVADPCATLERVPAEDVWEKMDEQLDLERLLGRLPELERAVLTCRRQGDTYQEVASALGMTRWKVKRIEDRGTARLRGREVA